MDAPRLPTTEADLADWSVYADELMRAGDPLGEIVALDLAQPVTSDPKTLTTFQRAVKKHCWMRRKTTDAAWALGHLRELALRPYDGMSDLDGGTLANVTALLRSPIAATLEHLHLVTKWHEDTRPALRRLLAALPPTCTRLTTRGPYGGAAREPLDLVRMVELIPPTIEQLTLVHHMTNVGGVIDDRFESVHIGAVELHRESIERRLARTSRVIVETDKLVPGWHPRIVVRDGAGVIEPAFPRATSLRPPTLFEQQEHVGVVPIRAQLARSLPEHYTLELAADLRFGRFGNNLQRRGDRWTLRLSPTMRVGDDTGKTVDLADGALIESTSATRVRFYTHDLSARAKAM